jgi:hypothetical protein
MRDAYETQWKKSLSADAFEKAIRRLGISSEQRKQLGQEAKKQTVCKDISEYRQYRAYDITAVKITKTQKEKQLRNIRRLWEIMDCANPEEWTYESLLAKFKTIFPMKTDERGREVFEHPGSVSPLLTAFNTIFPGILPKGWYSDYAREAGELKDYFSLDEYAEFKVNLHDTPIMPRIGWCALYDEQVNLGCREGSELHTGILSLAWENINYGTRRCSLRDKGGRGKAARLWKNLPLDLFPHLNGWNELLEWHKVQFGYTPSNERHATGRCFNFAYDAYSRMFRDTRHRCSSRIAEDGETMRPHVLRMTHAQWLVKLRVQLERICGQFPDGRFGVGWDNSAILLRYYVTLESDDELAPLSAWEKSSLWREHTFLPRLEESDRLLTLQH